jgi:hypothetical protein
MTDPLIMIAAPVRDREWILPDYLEKIYNLDYPKDKIALRFLINDSKDKSDDILVDFKNKHASEYRDITLYRVNLGAVEDGRKAREEKGIFDNLAKLRNQCFGLLDGEEWILSIDTDILADPKLLRQLLSHDKLCVCALVKNSPSKIYNIMELFETSKVKMKGSMLEKMKAKGGIPKYMARHIQDFKFSELIQVGVLGACCLYHKNIATTCDFKHHVQGEDIGFCIEAKEFGYPLFCDTTPGLATHVMDKVSWMKDKTINYNWVKNEQV